MSLWSAWTLNSAFRDVLKLPRDRAASRTCTHRVGAAQSAALSAQRERPEGTAVPVLLTGNQLTFPGCSNS